MAIFRVNSENSLQHDRSIEDRKRHRDLVEKSIKENLGDILSEESIIGENQNKKYKIPIRGIKEYEFIFKKNNKGVLTGTGNEKRGQKIGDGSNSISNSKEDFNAGNMVGEDVYETEITLEELLNYIVDDIELPNLDKKKYSEIVSDGYGRKKGYQRYGIKPRLSKKKTVIRKIARKQGHKRVLMENGITKKIERFPFKEEDLRYYKLKKKPRQESNAVMIFIMDISGSMDNSKKFMARSLFFVLSRFLKRKYNNIAFEFISHTTIAKVVNEFEFFHKAESGGTYISSGINKALELIEIKYPANMWNIYPIYASDGDNWAEDNDKAMEAVKKICEISNMFGYAELLPSAYSKTMYYKFKKAISCDNFVAVIANEKKDLWLAIKKMLSQDLKEG
ncbi:MAG: YeaH/YhbH family protein [Clostridium sp.]|nr:YeaH/YhbH family protein [Clostridium sp.]